MKYYLFAANGYDDEIGMFAYRGAFDTVEEARAARAAGDWNVAQIAVVDPSTLGLKTFSEWRHPQPGDPEYVSPLHAKWIVEK